MRRALFALIPLLPDPHIFGLAARHPQRPRRPFDPGDGPAGPADDRLRGRPFRVDADAGPPRPDRQPPGADRGEWFAEYGRVSGPLNARGLLVSVDGRPLDSATRRLRPEGRGPPPVHLPLRGRPPPSRPPRDQGHQLRGRRGDQPPRPPRARRGRDPGGRSAGGRLARSRSAPSGNSPTPRSGGPGNSRPISSPTAGPGRRRLAPRPSPAPADAARPRGRGVLAVARPVGGVGVGVMADRAVAGRRARDPAGARQEAGGGGVDRRRGGLVRGALAGVDDHGGPHRRRPGRRRRPSGRRGRPDTRTSTAASPTAPGS